MKTYKQILLSTIALAAAIAGAVWYTKKHKYITTATKMTDLRNSETKLPRGYRNNNPLNIRYDKRNNWQGKVLPNTDGQFEIFSAIEYGYRAALYLMRRYIREYNLNTVAALISRWAPNNENDTARYISRVCETTGYLPSTTLNANNGAQLRNLAYAMALVENGYNPLPDAEQIKTAWDML